MPWNLHYPATDLGRQRAHEHRALFEESPDVEGVGTEIDSELSVRLVVYFRDDATATSDPDLRTIHVGFGYDVSAHETEDGRAQIRTDMRVLQDHMVESQRHEVMATSWGSRLQGVQDTNLITEVERERILTEYIRESGAAQQMGRARGTRAEWPFVQRDIPAGQTYPLSQWGRSLGIAYGAVPEGHLIASVGTERPSDSQPEMSTWAESWPMDEDEEGPLVEEGLLGGLGPGADVEPVSVPEDVRSQIIAQYIATPEGRSRLAASMAAPLRTRRDYASLGRQLFQVQQLPEGALPLYNQDPDPVVPPQLADGAGNFSMGRRVTVPEFEMVTSPTVRLDEIQQRRFNLMDRMDPAVGYDANGSPVAPEPFPLPEWVRPGQWIYYGHTDQYAVILSLSEERTRTARATGYHTVPYVHVRYWRQHPDMSDLTHPGDYIAQTFVPCEQPPEPRAAWTRLLDDPVY